MEHMQKEETKDKLSEIKGLDLEIFDNLILGDIDIPEANTYNKDEALEDKDCKVIDLTTSKLHFAFLFSSPLTIASKPKFISQLDYPQMIDNFLSDLSAVEYELIFKYAAATKENFEEILNQRPIFLHFTGHGIKNTKKNQDLFGNEYNQDNGDALVFEDSIYQADVIFENELKNTLLLTDIKFELVVISACHSENIGKMFLSTCANHVICIKRNEKVLDIAAVLFYKIFYLHLFVYKTSICKAFNIAKVEVNNRINPLEAYKFLILKKQNKL